MQQACELLGHYCEQILGQVDHRGSEDQYSCRERALQPELVLSMYRDYPLRHRETKRCLPLQDPSCVLQDTVWPWVC